jgi:hypothetical protein
MSDEFQEFVLTAKDAVDSGLEIPAAKRHFGAEPDLAVNGEEVTIRVGSRPRGWNLAKLYKKQNRELPPELDVLRDGYDIWLVMNVVNVMKEPGSHNVRRLGLEVKYDEDDGIAIADVFPRTSFLNVVKGTIEGQIDAGIDFGGHLVPAPVGASVGDALPLSAGASLKVSTKASMLATLSMTIVTPLVEAIGNGDSFAKWVLTRHDKPLLGEHTFYQVLLVSPLTTRLEYEARVSATITWYGLVESPRRTGWIKLTCDLHGGDTK